SPWWLSGVPSGLPQITETGTYTLRMAAFDTGTFDLASNVAMDEFMVAGTPFVEVSSDSDDYWLMGDTAEVSLDFKLPFYPVMADLVIVVLTPDGEFYSPLGHGTGVDWAPEIRPLYERFSTEGLKIPDALSWEVDIPMKPFDVSGEFCFFAAFVKPGTISPLSDIGIKSITLQ
ncbi:MAG: hypothetical protein JW941_10950, partial [Candidatus Coatesbacteria bacterium]|nr:hypothetical protein [Candidatus Coatesbacteria bacterium]